jgi:hypothetical protein
MTLCAFVYDQMIIFIVILTHLTVQKSFDLMVRNCNHQTQSNRHLKLHIKPFQ